MMKLKMGIGIILCLLFCFCILPVTSFAAPVPEGCWSDYAAEDFAGGTGTKEDPYQVATEGQLAKIAKDVNSGNNDYEGKYFRLENNFDLSAHRWKPIGYILTSADYKTFKGFIDGNKKTINGLFVDEREEKFPAGFFGKIGNSTTGETAGAKDMTISDACIYTGENGCNYPYAGILAGFAQSNQGYQILFENIMVSGNVEIVSTDGNHYVGGMFGYADRIQAYNCKAENISVSGGSNSGGFVGGTGGSTYKNCSASGIVSGAWAIGGFAGYTYSVSTQDLSGQSTFDRCAADVNIEGYDWRLGGFTGYAECGKFNNCVVYGNVNSTVDGWEPKVGGFFGESSDVTVEHCHVAGKVTSASPEYKAGGFIGTCSGGIYTSSSFDNEKNVDLEAAGTGSVVQGIEGADSSAVLADICENYYDGHDYSTELIVDKLPTCTEEGSQSYHCERCGSKKDSQIIPPMNHDWGRPEWSWAEDCSSVTVTFTCNNDSIHKETPEVALTSMPITEVSCTENGEKVNIATVDFNGETYTDKKTVVVTAPGHQADTEWKSDETGHWKECVDCGSRLNEAAHTFKWVTDKKETETEAGAKHEECTVCVYKKAAVEIPSTGIIKPTAPQKPVDPDKETSKDETDPQKPTTPNIETSKIETDIPRTGDDSNLNLYLVLMGVSSAGLLVAAACRRKRK